ncbi:DUF2892 domain-containing protein [Verrucomicrobium sp. BvORR106]|uniref:YgaP family membrane protein n=1 Tax=Verrucomicrobium sp. BvORR106 TaxID=1403819 RepID=UPI00056EDB01|nr:DUF2892 domain-containing protein [Verrucomicrobium sp. BvORR106]
MSLTYQPFAEVPEVVELGKQLDKNVGPGERWVTLALSGMFFAAGLRSRGLAAVALHAGALALSARSVTAHCPLYYRLGVNTNRPGEPAPEQEETTKEGLPG